MGAARTSVALARACHPGPTAAVTAIATALGASAGAPAGRVAAAFLAGQLTTGWTNDLLDRQRDAVAGRRDKPVPGGDLSSRTLRAATVAAAVCCVPLSLALGPVAGGLHLLAVASAFTYNAGLKAGPLSFLPYALSFGLIPSVVTQATRSPHWPPAWASAAAALLGVGAHLANALPDLADDAATGVHGLPHRLGRALAEPAAGGLLLAATVVLVLGPHRAGGAAWLSVALAAAVVAGGAWLGRGAGSRAPFRAAIAVALLDVLLLLARGSVLR